MALKPVTDTAVLSQLRDGSAAAVVDRKPVTDPALLAQLNGGAPKVRTGLQHATDTAGVFARHPFTASVGMLENAASGIGAGVGSVAEALTGSDPGTYSSRWAYSPRTQAGQEIAQLGSEESERIGKVYDKVAGTGPLAQTVKERFPQAASAVGTVAGARAIPALTRPGTLAPRPKALTAEDVVSRLDTSQSMGAAAAAPRLQSVSPELRQSIVETAKRTGGAVNPDVLARHVDADSLPVRMRLTEGQATGDVTLLSQEQNMRGRTPQFAERFNEQNRALGQNLQAIRDEAGPDVFSANVVEHGDTLINAYRAVDADRQAQVTAAYNALRQGAGGQFPVGARTLLDNASTELHRRLLFDHAPASVIRTLERLAASPGAMTFENFESLRTNLARIQRSSQDGNERAAAGVIRQAMEDLPLEPGAERLKPLADAARRLARERFAAIEADPAYAAAINETVPPDQFVSRFVVRGTRDDLGRMRATIGGDETAAQTIGVAVLDHLRDQARLNPGYEGNFATASYNKALSRLSPGLRSALSPRAAEQLEQLGRVATYTTAQPRGSFVNNSNTFVAGAREVAAGAAEGAANVAALGVPVGTWTRQALQRRGAQREATRAMAPGAGLGRLTEAQIRQQALAQALQNRGTP